jgi:hypothetical protein
MSEKTARQTEMNAAVFFDMARREGVRLQDEFGKHAGFVRIAEIECREVQVPTMGQLVMVEIFDSETQTVATYSALISPTEVANDGDDDE